ncbi:MAG: hypothetical protein JNL58_17160 [Planctomyces sp.]|nr:hypothetical protein [Planctomyces sp.]
MADSLNQNSSFGRVLLATAAIACIGSALAAQQSIRQRQIRIPDRIFAENNLLSSESQRNNNATAALVNPFADAKHFADLSHDGQNLIGEGQWVFPENPWSFFQSEPKRVVAPQERLQQLQLVSSTSPVKPIDRHLLELTQSLMNREEQGHEKEDTDWYTIDREGFKAAAMIRMIEGDAIPVAICIQWKAYNDLWTEVLAQRDLRISARSAIQLPPRLKIHATRVSEAGIPQCHLVAGAADQPQLIELFRTGGWIVDVPPASSGIINLFRVTKATDRLEVSLLRGKPGIGPTALIRRI